MNKSFFWASSFVSVFVPFLSYAADNGLFGVLGTISSLLAFIIPILITLAVVYFIWGVINYLIGDNEEKKKKAKGVIFSGLVGLFVIISFWGIIRVFSDTFNVGPEQLNEDAIPCIPNEAAGIDCIPGR
jgi:hypothetical protein